MAKKYLLDAVDEKSAFEQPDYPYGRELRCKRRVWVETREKFGQRFVHQTDNPRKASRPWNKPHEETYHWIVVLVLDEESGRVDPFMLDEHYPDRIEPFIRAHAPAFRVEGYRRERAKKALVSMRLRALLQAKAVADGIDAGKLDPVERKQRINELRPEAEKQAEAFFTEVAPLVK